MKPAVPAIALVLSIITVPVAAESDTTGDRIVASIDFTHQDSGDAMPWLREQGFEFHLSADQINPQFRDNRLMLETSGQYAGLISKPVNIDDVDRVRITWGVSKYPEGADWEAGIYRVPIAVMLSFGEETVDSGSLLMPDTPYFVGLFLGEHEQEGRAYTAQYYREAGRYFCQPCSPEPGKLVTTEFDFDRALKRNFNISSGLPVTSVGIQMNTNDTRGGAQAFVKKIEFLADRAGSVTEVADAGNPEE